MKNFFELLKQLPEKMRAAVLLLTLLTGVSASAQTRLTPAFFTNAITGQLVTSGATTNIQAPAIAVNPGYGFGLTVKEHSALTTSATNSTVNINVSPDGVSWPSPAAYSIQVPHVPNTTNFWYTNLPSEWFDGGMSVRIESVTNNDSANSITFDQVTLSRRRLDYQ